MYDLAIIGAGAAGISAAKAAVKNKLKTVIIEQNLAAFGGTCLNQGCIPAKFFLNSAKLRKSWKDTFLECKKILEKIKTPLYNYLESCGGDIVWGGASFNDKNTLSVEGKTLKAKNIIVACGSLPNDLVRHPKAISAQEIFNQESIGGKILIVGAGYIGLEMASLLNNFGKEIILVEKENRVLTGFNSSLAKRLRIILERKGIKIDTGADITNYNFDNYDLIVLATGRKPNLKNLKLELSGASLNNQGWIRTNESMKTDVDNIYACGDIGGKKLLAYAAEYQARLCVSNIIGNKEVEDYQGLPESVFTIPQAAQAGIFEEEAEKKGIEYKVIKSNFLRFSSSYVYNDPDGFLKIVVDKNEKIIGAGIISNQAAELINTLSLCIKNNLKLSDLKRCLFIHPTLSEIISLCLFDN